MEQLTFVMKWKARFWRADDIVLEIESPTEEALNTIIEDKRRRIIWYLLTVVKVVINSKHLIAKVRAADLEPADDIPADLFALID